jgi:hypothetical protein
MKRAWTTRRRRAARGGPKLESNGDQEPAGAKRLVV